MANFSRKGAISLRKITKKRAKTPDFSVISHFFDDFAPEIGRPGYFFCFRVFSRVFLYLPRLS